MAKTYSIRQMLPSEHVLLLDFTYEAIFKRPSDGDVPRTVLQLSELVAYYQDFGERPGDLCLVAEADGFVVGAAWARVMKGYGNVGGGTPELAMSLYPAWRGRGIGTELLGKLLDALREKGVQKVSLSVQPDNYACQMYLAAGFEIIEDRGGELIMAKRL